MVQYRYRSILQSVAWSVHGVIHVVHLKAKLLSDFISSALDGGRIHATLASAASFATTASTIDWKLQTSDDPALSADMEIDQEVVEQNQQKDINFENNQKTSLTCSTCHTPNSQYKLVQRHFTHFPSSLIIQPQGSSQSMKFDDI